MGVWSAGTDETWDDDGLAWRVTHSYHTCNTYIRAHTRVRGRYPSCTDTLSFFFVLFCFLVYIYIYVHIHTYAHIHTYTYIYIYTHTYVNIHIPATMHTQVRGRYPSCTVYILPRHCIPGWGGDTPAAPSAHFSELCTLRWGGDTPAAPWHVLAYMHYGKGNGWLISHPDDIWPGANSRQPQVTLQVIQMT